MFSQNEAMATRVLQRLVEISGRVPGRGKGGLSGGLTWVTMHDWPSSVYQHCVLSGTF